MLLNSLALPLWIFGTAALSWLAPRSAQTSVMALLAILFLAFHAPLALGLLLFMVVLSYGAVRGRERWPLAPAVAVAVMVTLFVVFKGSLGHGGAMAAVAVPLGLAYFTLRAIHYCLEGWKGTLPAHGFADYLRYHLFLPTLAVGPIHRFQDFQQACRRRRWDAELFSLGCERILYGTFKVVVLGNWLVSTWLMAVVGRMPHASPLRAWLECLTYGLNLYAQFSGYSDVAIGFALLLGIRIRENFDYPFLARNLEEFWRRWHISLTSWCRDYLYLPVLAGSRRPLLAILAAMLGMGLWHEASPRYVVWGFYQGAGIAFFHVWRRVKGDRSLPAGTMAARFMAALAILLTLNFITLGFALTKEPDLKGAFQVYATLLGRGRP